MEPSTWISSLSNNMLETIVVVQFIVIFFLFRKWDQAREDHLQLVIATSKSQSELQVATNKSVDASTNAISSLSELVKQLPWRGGRE